MSQVHAPAPRAGRDSGRQGPRGNRRKPQTAGARTPEPQEIISGAGHPLDPGTRRDLEARLGHDFSRVRVHTDRDAAALTGLLGADAVTVGTEIFFGEGAFRPGTEDGRRLLAHELLHTVQAPHSLGALGAGRDLGAVSLPQDAAEREAEAGARGDTDPGPGRGADVSRQATPGWLRYATVDADRHRTERLDPATLVDRLTAGILRSLRGDPTDSSGRVRLQIARLSPELQESVLDRIEDRLPSSAYDRVLDLVEDAGAGPEAAGPARAPEPVVEGAERTERERDRAEDVERDREQHEEDVTEDARREEEQDTERPDGAEKNPGAEPPQERRPEPRPGGAETERPAPDAEGGREQGGQDRQDRGEQAPAEAVPAGPAAPQRPAAEERPGGAPERGAARGGPQAEEQPAEEERLRAETAAEEDGKKEKKEEPAEGSVPREIAPRAAGQPGPVRPERVDRIAGENDSPLEQHGIDDEEGDPREEEQPLGLEADAGKEIDAADGGSGQAVEGVADVELKPEDFLPDTDLDVSSVPTADRIDLSGGGAPPSARPPAFPAPPPTRAEQVQAEREAEAEDAAEEGETGPEPLAAPAGAGGAPAGGPVAEARESGARDLEPEKPVEQEVGPDPGASARADAEPVPGPEPDEDAEDVEGPEDTREDRKVSGPGPGAGPDAGSESEAAGLGAASSAPAAGSAAPAPPSLRDPAGVRAGAEPAAGHESAARRARGTAPGTGPGGPAGTPAGGTAAAGPAAAAGPDSSAVPGPAAEQNESPAGVRAAPDASLEPGGGGCAGPQQPTTGREEGPGGCAGGGGGRGGEQEEKQPEPPDVSGQDPQSAVAAAGSVPLDRAQTVLDGADGAVARSVGEDRAELEAAPPTEERPSGAPRTLSGPPEAEAPAEAVSERVDRIGPDGKGEQERAKGKKAEGRRPTEQVGRPVVAQRADNGVSARDVENMQAAVDGIPDTDPALNTTVGAAPKVELTGESDPERTDKQLGKLEETSGRILEVGREDAAKGMGEDQVYPDVPPETLTAEVPAGDSGGGRGQRATGADRVERGVAIVAEQERGDRVKASVGRAQGDMSTARSEHERGEAGARLRTEGEIDRAEAENAEAQAGEREGLAERVGQAREDWRAEQDEELSRAEEDAGKEHGEKNKEIRKKRTDTDTEVEERKDEDNRKIQEEREKAEEEARKKKEEKKDESSGWLGWIADKVKAAFDALLDAVTAVFDAARRAVNSLIEGFRTFVDKAIEAARKFAVDLINKVADALVAIGDVLLAAFPELREKFRNRIEEWRDAAIDKVNEWADRLKEAVNKLLDLLAAGLSALLDALEAGLRAAVAVVRDAVVGAIEFARQAVAAFGQFAALVADIAPDPGGWLANLGGSAREGVQNHLWGAVRSAVRQWFDEKLQAVVGIGPAVVNALVKGCMSMAQIGRMAWEAVVASLPGIIVSIVVEKVVSMIVPAAGAVLTIIQGLMAAWDTVSRIVAAFGKFFEFLKAVKGGNAACLFAEAVAAGVVALLDFITNFLLAKLQTAAKGVGTRLKAMARRITKALEKTARGPRKALGGDINRARQGLRAANRAMAASAAARGRPTGPRVPSRPGTPAARRGPGRTTVTAAARRPDRVTAGAGPGRGPGRPPAPRTDTRGPGRADDRTPDREPEQQPRTPEAAPPRKTPRRRPASPAGRALKRARRTVEAALRRVRTAGRAMGRKLRSSRIGRALDNSARRMRDAYSRRRDLLRRQQKIRQEQLRRRRDERRGREDSPGAKSRRLSSIVARIRPRIEGALRRGVRAPVLRSLLAAMRMWYRLSALNVTGANRFGITATLNPSVEVTEGLTVDEQELLEMLNEISEEILGHPDVRAGAARIKKKGQSGNRREFAVPEGVGFASLAGFMRDNGQEMLGSSAEKVYDVFEFEGAEVSAGGAEKGFNPKIAHHVQREPDRVRNSRQGRVDAAPDERTRAALQALENADRFEKGLIKPRVSKVKRDGRVEERNKAGAPYRRKVSKSGRETKGIDESIFGDPDHGRSVLEAVEVMARGGRVGGKVGEDAAFVGSLILAKEVHRNRRTAVTAAMIVQMAARGNKVTGVSEGSDPKQSLKEMEIEKGSVFDMGSALKFLPMEGVGAMADARDLDRELERRGPYRESLSTQAFEGGQKMANREILAIQMWIKSLDIKTGEGGRITVLQHLKEQIRSKMYEFYGIA